MKGRQRLSRPQPTNVDGREKSGTHDREDGHGLGKAVNGCSPSLPEQEKNSGNKRTRMANTDPPHKVNNGPAPSDWLIQTPDTGSFPKEIPRSEEHTSELQSRGHLVYRHLLEKKKNNN